MKLRHRPLERAVRRLVRAKVRASEELRKERRRSRRWLQRSTGGWLLTVLFVAVVIVMTCGARDPLQVWTFVSLIATGYATIGSVVLRGQLTECIPLTTLGHYPVNSRDWFARCWRKVWMVAACSGLHWGVALVVIMAGAGTVNRSPSFWGLSAAFVLLQAGVAVATVAWLLRNDFRGFGCLGGAVLFILGVGDPLGWWSLPSWTLALTPSGWVSWMFQSCMGQASAWGWLGLPLLVGLVVAGRHAWKRVRADYVMPEVAWPGPSVGESVIGAEMDLEMESRTEVKPWLEDSKEDREAEREQVEARHESDTARSVRRGEFLEGEPWGGTGLPERIAWAWLTPRQRDVAEFLSGGAPRMLPMLKVAAVLMLIGVLAALFFQDPPTTAIFIAGLSAVAVTWQGGLGWPGMFHSTAAAMAPTMYSCYPLGYKEMARVMLKLNLVRVLGVSPLLFLYLWLVGSKLGFKQPESLWIAAKIVCLNLSLQPLLVIACFARGTNGPKGWLGWMVVLPWMILAAGVFIFASAGLFLDNGGLMVILAGVCAATVSATYVLYGWYFRRARSDLIFKPSESG